MSDIDYRSWGDTRNCKGCRYWSEMLAKSGVRGVDAVCLAVGGPQQGKFTPESFCCTSFEAGWFGAVDQPGGNPYELPEGNL